MATEKDKPATVHPTGGHAAPAAEHKDREAEARAKERERQRQAIEKASEPEPLGPNKGRDQTVEKPKPGVPGLQAGPLADPDLPVPRVIRDFERAPAGLQRFKCWAKIWQGQVQPTQYVLAPAGDEDAARDFY